MSLKPETVNFIECEVLDPMLRSRWGTFKNFPAETAHILIKQKKVIKALTKFRDVKEEIREEKINYDKDIPVFIPWSNEKRIGKSYNRFMQYVNDWVLFVDHDVFLVNPLWHTICRRAIDRVGDNVGWITCFTNRIYCKTQLLSGIDYMSNDIKYHRDVARNTYIKNKGKLIDITDRTDLLSGFFILTNKKAWETVGGFQEKTFFRVDNDYNSALKRKGFRLYLMADLYVYHSYFRDSINNSFERGT